MYIYIYIYIYLYIYMMKPCGKSARISAQDKHWLCKTTLCFLSLRNSRKILIISPQTSL